MLIKIVILALAAVSLRQGNPGQPGDPGDRKACDAMARSLSGNYGVNVVAIVSQRDSNETCYQTIQVERTRDGKIRHTVLSPICLQGSCSIEDGEHSLMYYPDDKLLIKQDARNRLGEGERRAALAMRNYTFKLEGSCHVAGMRTTCVLATPTNSEMHVRRYYLDQKTAYPLKLETIDEDGKSVVEFETKDIQYPKSLDPKLFTLSTIGEVNCVEYRRPSSVDPKNPGSAIGFKPLIPQGLPMGFQIQEVQVNDSDRWHALIVRMTDGLVRATVFQWKITRANASMPTIGESAHADFRGVRLMLVADMPGDLRDKLLSAFIHDAEINPADVDDFALIPH